MTMMVVVGVRLLGEKGRGRLGSVIWKLGVHVHNFSVFFLMRS